MDGVIFIRFLGIDIYKFTTKMLGIMVQMPFCPGVDNFVII